MGSNDNLGSSGIAREFRISTGITVVAAKKQRREPASSDRLSDQRDKYNPLIFNKTFTKIL